MTPLLNRKLGRDLLAIKGRVVSLLLIISSGVGILFGVEMALGNLLSTLEERLNSMQFADLEIQFERENARKLPDLRSLDGVAAVQDRLLGLGQIDLGKDAAPLQGLIIFQDDVDAPVNRLDFVDGRGFQPGSNETVIDRALAEYHGLAVGDQLRGQVGGFPFSLKIVGVAVSPEFLVTSSNPDYIIAEPGSLGILWADIDQVTNMLRYRVVNSLLVKLADGATPEIVTDDISVALTGADVRIENIIPRDESYSYKSVRMDVLAFGVYSPAIIVTLCLLSLGMGVITFRRFVVEKQREFGVLVAIGYTRRALFKALVNAGVLLGFGGGLIGLVVGWGLGVAFADAYAAAMHLQDVIHSFDLQLALLALAVGVASGCLAFLGASLPLWFPPSRLSARQLLDGAVPKAARNTVGRLGGLPVALRYSLRSLMRDKALSLSSIIAMGAAVGVSISYGLAMSSTFGTVEASFGQERWRFAVDLVAPTFVNEGDRLFELSGVTRAEPYYRTVADVRSDGRRIVSKLVGMSLSGQLRVLKPARGRTIEQPGEAVVSVDVARDVGVDLSGTIEVRKGRRAERLTVVGITNDIFLRTVTTALPTVQSLAQAEDKANGYYVGIHDDVEDGASIGVALGARDQRVARVTDKDRLVRHFRQQVEDMMGIVYITIVFSVVVSLLFVTTLMYLSIAEKRGEYAILRSLGYTSRRLRTIIVTGAGTQVLLAMVLAVPLGLGLVEFLNGRMGEAWFAVETHYRSADFFLPMLAVLLVAPGVALLGARYVTRLNVSQYLRERAV